MEAVVEQKRVEIERRGESRLREEDLEEARARVDVYLRAWRLPDSLRDGIAAAALAEARLHAASPSEALALAIEEVEKALRPRLDEMLGEAIPPLRPQREPETHPMTMETSLTRLPSFRIIAGWFVLIALIVLAFIFTR